MKNYFEYRDILYIIIVLFLQYMVLNILPEPFNSIELFLILAGIYSLKADVERLLLFVFIGGLITESVYPSSNIIGIKTISALFTAFTFFHLSKKMVIKNTALCIVVALYCLTTILLTVFLTSFVYPIAKTPLTDYIVFTITSMLFSCLIVEKINV